jgi:glutathione peroxidase
MHSRFRRTSSIKPAILGAILIPAGANAASNQANLPQPTEVTTSEEKPVSKYVLDYEMKTLDGKPVKLESYKGKVILMVNVASKCGLTPQYKGLEALYKQYKDDGLVIIGFPANNFGNQEPGSDKEIAEFCSLNYGVTFPMMSKVSVKGKDVHPLYKQLAAQPEPVGGAPQWNFDKFLVNHEGEVVIRHSPRITPEDKNLIADIERLIKDAS